MNMTKLYNHYTMRFVVIHIILGIVFCGVLSAELEQPQTPIPTPLPAILPSPSPSATPKQTPLPGDARDSAEESMQALLKTRFAPPLSIFETIRLVESLIELLNPSVDVLKPSRKEKAQKIMTLVSAQVKLTDERVSSLLYYKWYKIGNQRVEGETIEEKVYNPQPPIRNVSAISFEATGGNVQIHFVKVIDTNGKVSNFNVNKWIFDGLPHKEVCYLYFPANIKSVIVDYSAKTSSRARLTVFAGVTDRPEHGKVALYYLTRVAKSIESDNFAQSEADLVKAREALISFNRQLRQ